MPMQSQDGKITNIGPYQIENQIKTRQQTYSVSRLETEQL